MKSKIIYSGIALIVAIQFIPVNQSNPVSVHEPDWDTPQTRTYAKRVCFNCHSNETVWPWYAHVAPVSWLITHDVNEGREELNMSDWRPGDGKKAPDEFEENEMPPTPYLWLHPEAKLSPAEQKEFLKGLKATFEVKETELNMSSED
ncbi:MAG: heme-binding domain-containing protein [FCB group bacterium]|nr:heme-binding domain-containing protein [FCB group bacterium]